MSLGQTNAQQQPFPEGEKWGADGTAGVLMRVCRFPDGSAVFTTYHESETHPYALHLPAATVMSLQAFLLNLPAELNG